MHACMNLRILSAVELHAAMNDHRFLYLNDLEALTAEEICFVCSLQSKIIASSATSTKLLLCFIMLLV